MGVAISLIDRSKIGIIDIMLLLASGAYLMMLLSRALWKGGR